MKWACVTRLGSIGDNLIASSVLPLLKRQGYMIEVIAQGPNHVVFENNPHIDKLTVLRADDMPNNNAEWQQYWVRRSHEFEKFYHLSHSIESLLAFSPDSTWFNWPGSMRRQWCNHSYLGVAHDICELPHEFAPGFFPTDDEMEKARVTGDLIRPRRESKIVGWVIAGSRIDKIYPYSPMAIGRIISELGASVVLFGGANEKDFTAAKIIQDHVKLQNGSTNGLHAAISTSENDWPLRRALVLLQTCDLVISPDTGPAWAVASCPMPKIIMLGHASAYNITYGWKNTTTLTPDRARVPCYPCHRLHNDASTCVANAGNNGAACISDTTVERLLLEARNALSAPVISETKEAYDGDRGRGDLPGQRNYLPSRRPARRRAKSSNGIDGHAHGAA
jgi:ADP-heptose:LPS heptosyltransferase